MQVFIILVVSFLLHVPVLAQDQSNDSTVDMKRREAVLKSLAKQDHGEITALEASTLNDGSVLVGYASGNVLMCDNEKCTKFGGTPNTAVRHITVSPGQGGLFVWVAYGQSALYHCSEFLCRKASTGI